MINRSEAMEAIVLDTETTGLDAPELVEAAWLPIDIHANVAGAGYECRYQPSKPISLGAMATHNIMDEDLIGKAPASEFRLPAGVAYIVGYNVDFDWNAIGRPDVKRIDVCAMCRHLWPEADSHSQSAMLYLLDRHHARMLLQLAHSALADVINCRTILAHVIEKAGPFASFTEMWQASERMRIPSVMPFGKHRGTAIRDLPRDYRQWMLQQKDMDPYLLQAVRNSMPGARVA